MRVQIIGDKLVLEGTPKEIVQKFDFRAEHDTMQYMKEFAHRYKLYYGNPLFYHDEASFLTNLDGSFLNILD